MSILLSIHEPWHFENWEPVLRHMQADEVSCVLTPWCHRGQDPVVQHQALARTSAWLDQRNITYQTSLGDQEPHVLATLAIDERAVHAEYGRQVRMLYAVISKQYTYSKLNEIYDAVMVASSFGANLLKEHDVRAVVVGYPKLDDVFNGVLTQETARARLGLDPSRKLVVYAPTFGEMCTVERFAAAFDQLDESVDLLVQLHPVSYIGELSRFAPLGPRFGWIPEEAAGLATLVAADVVVTDYSGVIFEACAIDVPVILLDDPQIETTADVERAHRDAGPRVEDPGRLAETVETQLARPEEYAERRGHYRERFFEYRGTAGLQVAEALRGFETEAREARARDAEAIFARMRQLEATLGI